MAVLVVLRQLGALVSVTHEDEVLAGGVRPVVDDLRHADDGSIGRAHLAPLRPSPGWPVPRLVRPTIVVLEAGTARSRVRFPRGPPTSGSPAKKATVWACRNVRDDDHEVAARTRGLEVLEWLLRIPGIDGDVRGDRTLAEDSPVHHAAVADTGGRPRIPHAPPAPTESFGSSSEAGAILTHPLSAAEPNVRPFEFEVEPYGASGWNWAVAVPSWIPCRPASGGRTGAVARSSRHRRNVQQRRDQAEHPQFDHGAGPSGSIPATDLRTRVAIAESAASRWTVVNARLPDISCQAAGIADRRRRSAPTWGVGVRAAVALVEQGRDPAHDQRPSRAAFCGLAVRARRQQVARPGTARPIRIVA